MDSIESQKSKTDAPQLSRRSFLKGLGAASVAAAIPSIYSGNAPDTLTGGWKHFVIDPKDYGIVIDAKGISAVEVYEWVKYHTRFSEPLYPFEAVDADSLEFSGPTIEFRDETISV